MFVFSALSNKPSHFFGVHDAAPPYWDNYIARQGILQSTVGRMQWDDPEAGRKRLGLLQKQCLFNMRPYMRPPAAKLSFQIGVAESRFVKPFVKISQTGSCRLMDGCPINLLLPIL